MYDQTSADFIIWCLWQCIVENLSTAAETYDLNQEEEAKRDENRVIPAEGRVEDLNDREINKVAQWRHNSNASNIS